MDEPRLVTLGNIAEGAAEELFQKAFGDCLKNIDDPNTEWKPKRVISLQFTIQPDERRNAAALTVACATKFPGIRTVVTRVHIGRQKGELVAVEELRQEEMFPMSPGRPEAVPANAGGAA